MTKIQLKRSSVLLSGSAQAPGTSQLDYGEIAVNYNASDPQLFFKNSSGSVVSFFEPYAPLSGAAFTGDVSFATDVDLSGAVTIHGDATNGSGKLSLTCESDTHTVHLKAPAHSASANYTLTLPTSTGSSGEVLSTDGSGGLSWAYAAMSTADKSKLDGIEAGATGDQTAAEILTAIKTVDGNGSGLDSDTVDGLHAQQFIRSDVNDSASGTIDFNGPITGHAGVSTDGFDLYTGNGTLMFNDSNGAFADRTGSNIDHIWHDDSANRFHFVSDTTYKATGNAKLQCGEVHATGSGSVGGTFTIGSELNLMGSADSNKYLDVRVGGNTFHIRRTTGGDAGHESMFESDGNGGCRLYYDNAVKLETTNLGVTVTGRVTTAGLTTTTDLNISNDADLRVGNGTAGERILIQKLDNNVSDHLIFYNGTTRIGEIGCEDSTWLRINQETAKNIYTPRYIRADGGFFVDGTSKGINGSGNFIGGTIAGASDYNTLIRSNADDNVSGHTEWQDNYQVRLGAGADLRIFHNATNNYIDSYNGHIYIRANANTDLGHNIYIQARAGEHSIICNDDSSVVLYHNNTACLSTSSAEVAGSVAIYADLIPTADNQGNVGTSGRTWNNGRFTNMTIDSTLSVRGAVDLADGDYIRLGSSDDWTIYRNGNNWTYINDIGNGIIFQDNGTNKMRLEDSGIFRPETTNTCTIGTSSYYWDNGYFQDFNVSGTINVRGAVDLADNDILRLGSGDDAELFCNGSHLYLDLNSGIGNFYIRDGTTTRFTFDDNGNFTATGGATLDWVYHADKVRIRAGGLVNNDGTDDGIVVFDDGWVVFMKDTLGWSEGGVQFEEKATRAIFTTDDWAHMMRVNGIGAVLDFYSSSTFAGRINMSSSTVIQYLGGHLARLSQWEEDVDRFEIYRGTVLSNVDIMCEWGFDESPDLYWEEGDDIPEDKKVGDLKQAAVPAGVEENEQLNRVKVSDIVGDRNIAGVFEHYEDENDADPYSNKYNKYDDFSIAQTGDFIIRIGKDTVVEMGDLLMSAGDGTAMPQQDDIIRSCTIAKVTCTSVREVYPDGSYTVPCLLMAC